MRLPAPSRLVVLILLWPGPKALWSQSEPSAGAVLRVPCESVKWTLTRLHHRDAVSALSLSRLQSRPSSEGKSPRLHYELGRKMEEGGAYLQATRAYREALRLDPRFEAAVLELASRLFHCGQVSQSVAELGAFIENNPQAVAAMRLRSRIHTEDRKYEQALEWARRAQDLEPNSAFGHFLLGLAHQGLHETGQAAAEFEKAIDRAPVLPDPYPELGRLYASTADTFDLAVERFQEAIALGLDHPEIHKDLAAVLLKLERPEEAVRSLTRAVSLDPEFVQGYFLLARAYRMLGKEEESAAALQKFQGLRTSALEKKAALNQAQSHYEDGIEFFGKDRFQEAYQSFRQAIELLPTLDPAYHRLAQIDFLQGNLPAAAAWARKAIELYSLEGEYYFVLARCLERSDVAAAAQAMRRAIDLKPEVAEFHNLLGNLLFVQGDFPGAVRAYRQAGELEPDNAAFRLNLSAALARSGEDPESESGSPPREY